MAASGDLSTAHSAYHAELLVSALLGSVYSVATELAPVEGLAGGGDPGRAAAVTRFVGGLRGYLSGRRDRASRRLLAVLGSLVPTGVAGEEDVPPTGTADGSWPPPWLGQLGKVSATAGWAYGDRYADQVTYLVLFSYADEVAGGPEHAVAVLVDRNLGIVKDMFVAAPGRAVLDRMAASAEADESTYLAPIEPASVPALVAPYLGATDLARELPGDGEFAADWAVVVSRLRTIPDGRSPEAATLAPGRPLETSASDDDPVAAFRASAESDRLVGAPGDAASLEFCLDLIQRYASTRLDGDPLRWSPAAVERFLLDWVPRSAILDPTDRALLPLVLDAWVRWAGRKRGVPARDVARTVATLASLRARFVELSGDQTLRDPATQAVASMLGDGVDLADEEAVARWIERYNAERPSN